MQHNSSYDRILALLCSVFDAYSAVLFLPDGTDEGGHAIAAAFSLGDKLDYRSSVSEGRGLVGWILRNREPLLVSNFDQRQNYLGYYVDNEEQHIKAFMGCALAKGAGALCVDSKRQYSFSEKDQKLLHLFADLLAWLEEESRGRTTKLAELKYYGALRAIYALRRQYSRWAEFLRHFLDLMSVMTGYSYCVLCSRDPGGESYSVEGESAPLLVRGASVPSFPMTHGVVGWVFRNASPVFSGGDASAPETHLVGKGTEMPQFQAVLAVPLIIQRKTRGVLCLANDTPLPVDAAVQDFARMASEYLALFLENLYVKCRLRDLYREVHPDDTAAG